LDLTRQKLLSAIPPLAGRGQVVVTQGFVGASTEGITTTIGRGGSDYSAAIFAALLDAAELQIWTDVDGVLTADPSLVPAAMNIPEMTFDEAAELAYFGARVLHPSTILPAVEKDIPVRVLNSRRPDHPGTVIRRRTISPRTRIVQSIAYKEGVSLLTIRSNRTMIAPAFIAHVFTVFGAHHKVIDTIVTSETGISLTVRDREHLDEIVGALAKVGTVSWQSGRAVVTVVGEGLRQSVHARSAVFETLRRIGITVELVSLGGSDISITFVIRDEDIAETVGALHRAFFE
jgi:aspartate kinase